MEMKLLCMYSDYGDDNNICPCVKIYGEFFTKRKGHCHYTVLKTSAEVIHYGLSKLDEKQGFCLLLLSSVTQTFQDSLSKAMLDVFSSEPHASFQFSDSRSMVSVSASPPMQPNQALVLSLPPLLWKTGAADLVPADLQRFSKARRVSPLCHLIRLGVSTRWGLQTLTQLFRGDSVD